MYPPLSLMALRRLIGARKNNESLPSPRLTLNVLRGELLNFTRTELWSAAIARSNEMYTSQEVLHRITRVAESLLSDIAVSVSFPSIAVFTL